MFRGQHPVAVATFHALCCFLHLGQATVLFVPSCGQAGDLPLSSGQFFILFLCLRKPFVPKHAVTVVDCGVVLTVVVW